MTGSLGLASGSAPASAAAPASQHHGRLGPLALEAISASKQGKHLPASRVAARSSSHGVTYGVFILGTTSAAAIAATGATPHTVLSVGSTAQATLAELPALANLAGVTEVELAGKAQKQIDVSVPEIHASEPGHAANPGVPHYWAGTSPGFTGDAGQATIVGVVDTGLDLQNADFRTVSGTRVLDLWDQAACPSNTAGNCPTQPGNSQGFTYGAECSQASINANTCGPYWYGGDCETPINSGQTNSSFPEEDCDGHGTHVAGIAASNGRAGTAGTYIGVAPQSDLVVVKDDGNLADVVDGVNYIFKVAAAKGEAASVNLSLGPYDGPHDGTDAFTALLDGLTGPGKLISAAAGNQATNNPSYHYHIGGQISGGQIHTEQLRVGAEPVFIDIWYPGGAAISAAISDATVGQATSWVVPDRSSGGSAASDGTCIQPVPGSDAFVDPNGNVMAILSCTTMPENGQNEIQIGIYNQNNATGGLDCGGGPGSCTTQFQLLLGGNTPNTPFNGWMFDQGDYLFQGGDGNDAYTVGPPATGRNIISVGSYVDRTSWPNRASGTSTDPFGSVGQISGFSSLGPTADGRTGITIAAPGEEVVSSLSSAASSSITTACPSGSATGCETPDGNHLALQGTSMSSPHVAGAVALILQQRPTLTVAQAEQLLTQMADSSPVTAGGATTTWGAGKLRLGPGILSVTPNYGPLSGGATVTITGVDLQAGMTAKLGGTSVALTPAGTNTYTFTVPPGGQAGAADLLVTNPDASTLDLQSAYLYVNAARTTR